MDGETHQKFSSVGLWDKEEEEKKNSEFSHLQAVNSVIGCELGLRQGQE